MGRHLLKKKQVNFMCEHGKILHMAYVNKLGLFVKYLHQIQSRHSVVKYEKADHTGDMSFIFVSSFIDLG